MSFENPIFVAEGGFGRLREIGRILGRTGIATQIVAPPGESCANA